MVVEEVVGEDSKIGKLAGSLKSGVALVRSLSLSCSPEICQSAWALDINLKTGARRLDRPDNSQDNVGRDELFNNDRSV